MDLIFVMLPAKGSHIQPEIFSISTMVMIVVGLLVAHPTLSSRNRCEMPELDSIVNSRSSFALKLAVFGLIIPCCGSLSNSLTAFRFYVLAIVPSFFVKVISVIARHLVNDFLAIFTIISLLGLHYLRLSLVIIIRVALPAVAVQPILVSAMFVKFTHRLLFLAFRAKFHGNHLNKRDLRRLAVLLSRQHLISPWRSRKNKKSAHIGYVASTNQSIAHFWRFR